MPVVRGDRTAESRKLNSVSMEAQDFYARFIAVVPDDFGRFRFSASHVFVRMYPRREMTEHAVKRVKRLMKELQTAGLWVIWQVDTVTFAEVTNFSPTGNRWHRTPEPPAAKHRHHGACLPTAIHRAREWGDLDSARELSSQLNEIRERKETGGLPEGGPGGDRETPPPSPPFPNDNGTPPSPPARAGGDGADPSVTGAARRRAIAHLVDEATAYANGRGERPHRDVRRRFRDWAEAGCSLAEVKARIDAGEHSRRPPL